jgi:hypothetical protein
MKKGFLDGLAGAGEPSGSVAAARPPMKEAKRRQLVGPNGEPGSASLDPAKLDFCRVLYDYTPEVWTREISDAAIAGTAAPPLGGITHRIRLAEDSDDPRRKRRSAANLLAPTASRAQHRSTRLSWTSAVSSI